MSRRRRKNPLLTRIFLIALGVHIVLLPVLAIFIVKKREAAQSTAVVTIAPAPPVKEKSLDKKAPPKKPTPVAKGKGNAQKGGAKSNLPIPAVIGAQTSNGDANGPSVSTNGTGKAGQLPTAPAGPKGPDKPAVKPPAPEVKPPVTAPVQPKAPQPKPVQPVKPHVPVYVEASPLHQFQPPVPDDLLSEPLDATAVVIVQVDESGQPTGAQIITSSGNKELDQLSLEAAKKFTFSPQTKDGVAVASEVRLHFHYLVQ